MRKRIFRTMLGLCLICFSKSGEAAEEKGVQKLAPFAMPEVRLLDGPFKKAQDVNRRYMDSLDADRLLKNFRVQAGLSAPGEDLAGWEAPDCAIRGHFTGHYLSALALMYASTGDESLREKGAYMAGELGKVQAALGEGYLSAFPKSAWDAVEAGKPNWAQYYTIHKIMAGLFDQYRYCRNEQALEILRGMASYFQKRLEKFNPDQMAAILNVTEEGGMCDVLWNLYSATGEAAHRELAIRFEKSRFLTPMSQGQDVLAGLHGNTHIPLAIGAARRYEITGEETYRDICKFFWDCAAEKRCYATGGTTLLEIWPEANRLSDTLGYRNQECCKTYNMLKMSRHLFCWTGEPNYADYYERALFNSVLGTQDEEEGRLMYYIPLKTGFQKSVLSHSCHFYCCTGTGIESHSKFNDSIYFHDSDGIYVNLFISSTVNWSEKGIQLEQRTNFPEEDTARFVFHAAAPVSMALHIHVPSWASQGAELSINGKAQAATAKAGSYLTVRRSWSEGDSVEVRLPMALHTQPMPDDPEMVAILYGPLVLAGITEGEGATMPYIIPCGKEFPESDLHANADFFLGDSHAVADWMKPVAGRPLMFRTEGQPRDFTFIPFNRITGERFGVYWVIPQPGSARHQRLVKEKAVLDFLRSAEAFSPSASIEPLRAAYQQLKGDSDIVAYQEKMTIQMAQAELRAGNQTEALQLAEPLTKPFLSRDDARLIWPIIGKPQAGSSPVLPLLVVCDTWDGSHEKTEKDGRPCIAAGRIPTKSHIYFSLPEDSVLRNIDKTVRMMITYYSEGNANDTFFVEYDSFDKEGTGEGAYTRSRTIVKDSAKGWQTATVECPRARFSGRQNLRADFRINCSSGGTGYIADVRLEKP